MNNENNLIDDEGDHSKSTTQLQSFSLQSTFRSKENVGELCKRGDLRVSKSEWTRNECFGIFNVNKVKFEHLRYFFN